MQASGQMWVLTGGNRVDEPGFSGQDVRRRGQDLLDVERALDLDPLHQGRDHAEVDGYWENVLGFVLAEGLDAAVVLHFRVI